MKKSPLRRSDVWVTGGIVGATSLELLVREHFHRMLTELPALVLLWAGWALLHAFVMGAGQRAKWRVRQPVLMKIGQAIIVTACAALVLSPGLQMVSSPFWRVVAWGALTVAWCELVRRLPTRHWQRLHCAIGIAGLLFVISQPFLVAGRAPPLAWPAWPQPPTSRTKPPVTSVQLFVLLDELGAGAAGPIVTALERRQVPLRVLAIPSVGANTAQVIPALFSGGDFRNAKPCGWSSTCGSSDVVDFSKITASRDDVDVVGFYMPYCAIHGLRYCRRAVITAPLREWQLWGCAVLRRLDYFPSGLERPCAQAQKRKWKRLVDDVESALWQAPIWKRGGFLFAHLPLPHPPGNDASPNSMQEDYVANVEAASRLITQMVDRLRSEHVGGFSLVVFSDHSLRPNVWCSDPLYRNQSCAVESRLTASEVPLIVAGNSLPPVDRVRSNKDIFSIVPSVGETDR